MNLKKLDFIKVFNIPKLPENKLDVIFIISAYHHFQYPVKLLNNARSSLKPDGLLAIGEWLNATSSEQVRTQMTAAGYKLVRIETFLEENNMYIYIFQPNLEELKSKKLK